MIIVVEGCDGTGKTTLAREYEARGFRYVHNGPPPEGVNMFQEYARQVRDVKEGEDVVFDRLHLGELVYGTHMRGSARVSLEQIRLINRLLFAKGGLLIICSTSFGNVLKAWSGREEYVKRETTLLKIHDEYNELCQELRSPNVVRYDYALDQARPLLTRTPWQLRRCPQHVNGSPYARFLLVGERPGGERDEAFCHDQNSSAFLNRALWDAGYAERELSFVNSFGLDGKPHDLALIQKLARGLVWISLGGVAHRELEAQGIEHEQLSHPQYVKRFKSKERGRYVSRLRAIRLARREMVQ